MKLKNKRGNILSLVIFVGILFVVLFLGFIFAVGSSVLNWTFDEVVPELSNLGMAGAANMTDIASYTVVPAHTFVKNVKWMSGVLYVMILIGVLGIAMAFRGSMNGWLAGFFVLLILMLVMASIFISNIYEDFYDDPGDLGDLLKEHTILSWFILYSPMVMSVIGFLGGIILFSGRGEEAFV